MKGRGTGSPGLTVNSKTVKIFIQSKTIITLIIFQRLNDYEFDRGQQK